MSKLIAPFTPFISEYFYQKLERGNGRSDIESIHMTEFPDFNENLINPELEDSLSHIRNIVEAGRSARSSSNLKIRQPLSKIVCITESQIENNDLIDILKTELNVKSVEFKSDMDWAKNYKVNLNLKKVGPRYKKDLPKLKTQLESASATDIKEQLDKKGKYFLTLDGKDIELARDDIILEEKIPDDFSIGRAVNATVLLDTVITPELKQEAIAREVVRRIQVMRKDMDLDYSANIDIAYAVTGPIAEAIEAFSPYIQQETLGKTLKQVEGLEEAKKISADKSAKLGKTMVSASGATGTAIWELEEGEFQIEIKKIE
ncbi:MAG: class I tRNA ligase family protein [Thermoplasmata archaeon]|nr:MAG: class I tRNA ligase family protein [Thermoplasmata archaeon]